MKVIIVDDKKTGNSFSFKDKVVELSSELKHFFFFYEYLDNIVQLNDDRDEILDLKVNFNNISWMFVHQNIKHPFADKPHILLKHLPLHCGLVLFSGKKSSNLSMVDTRESYSFPQLENRPHYEIERSILYSRFERFIGTEKILGYFDLRALYEPEYNIQEIVIEELVKLIEVYEKNTIELDRFKMLLDYLNYSPNQIDSIIERFRSISCGEIIENLKQIKQ